MGFISFLAGVVIGMVIGHVVVTKVFNLNPFSDIPKTSDGDIINELNNNEDEEKVK